MLTHAPVTTMLPVKDLARARQFYEARLGLKPIGRQADGKFTYDCGGATLALFPKEGGTKADHTAISFRVPDIAASIDCRATSPWASRTRRPCRCWRASAA